MSTQIIVGLLTVVLTILIQAVAVGKMQGSFGARLTGAEERLDKLDEEQDVQWSKINAHGERISRIEGQTTRPNGGAH